MVRRVTIVTSRRLSDTAWSRQQAQAYRRRISSKGVN